MNSSKGFIIGVGLLTTKSNEEYERLTMFDPVDDAIADFFNLYQDTPKMWVHDTVAICQSKIAFVQNVGFGYVRIEISSNEGYTFKGTVEEVFELIGEEPLTKEGRQ